MQGLQGQMGVNYVFCDICLIMYPFPPDFRSYCSVLWKADDINTVFETINEYISCSYYCNFIRNCLHHELTINVWSYLYKFVI